jgi:hypothetical protein
MADVQETLVEFWLCMYNSPEAMPAVVDTRYSALLSPAALAFFKEVLVVHWRKRPTPAQLLLHPYLSDVVGDVVGYLQVTPQHMVEYEEF